MSAALLPPVHARRLLAWLGRAAAVLLLVWPLLTPAAPSAAVPQAVTAPAAAASAPLPDSILQALARAHIEPEALALWLAPVGREQPRLAHRPEALVHPASLMKLVTASAALDLLGPVHAWNTGIYLEREPDRDGVLHGSLWLQGRGDPRLTLERLWLLLRQVRQLGVREIRGDLLLDRSLYAAVPAVDPAAFDGEPSKPYNVRPDALQLNQKSLLLTLRPQPQAGIARVSVEPALDGLVVPASVPLSGATECGDWRTLLQAELRDPARLRLDGRYAAACGTRSWPIAYADPASYNARLLSALWRELGGRLQGRVREGRVPAGLAATLEVASPTLSEVVRDMNKHSNNVVAQQLFLNLGLSQRGSASWEAAREVVSARVQERAGCRAEELRLDNGSGLSRDERITPRCLARVLQWAWASPWMPELLASLPVAGVETTARRAVAAAGRAHLKTGSLNNVSALAGYLDPPGAPRQVLVLILNHPLAGSDEARGVLDAVLRWAMTTDDKELP